MAKAKSRSGRSTRGRLIAVGAALVVLAGILFVVWKYRPILLGPAGALGDAVSAETARVDLEIVLQGDDGAIFDGASPHSFPTSVEAVMAEQPSWAGCPYAIFSPNSHAPPEVGPTAPNADLTRCKANIMVFQTVRRDPLVTLTARPGADVYEWVTDNKAARTFLDSELGRGLFIGLGDMLKIRGEDLKIATLSGPVLGPVFKDALSADAQLDLGVAQGPTGTAFSFAKDKAGVAHRALIALVQSLTGVAYDVRQLSEPIVELRFGTRRLLIAEDKGRMYIATGLAGLVDALEVDAPVIPDSTKGSLVATVRGESMLATLLQTLAGKPKWHLHFGMELSEDKTAPGTAIVEDGRVFGAMNGKLPEAVLRSIPFDAFAGAAIALKLPEDLGRVKWDDVVANGVKQTRDGGVGIVWELDARTDGLTEIGLIYGSISKADTEAMRHMWRSSELVGSCNGAVLAATSAALLTRMRESCDGKSLSVVDWREKQGAALTEQETFVFLNPAIAGREFYIAGGGRPDAAINVTNANDANVDAAQIAAKAQAMKELQERTTTTLDQLPLLGYGGARQPTGELALIGFTALTGAQTTRE